MTRRTVLVVAAALLSACAAGGQPGTSDPVVVFAAASLRAAFEDLEPGAAYSFGGSNLLASQIRHGAPADVYASASPVHARELFDEGLVDRPRVFATNELVVIVPQGNPAGVRSVADLGRPGLSLLIGARGVPAGDYARRALRALGATSVLDNVVSEEQEVTEIVGKIALGEADAGFAYVTDVGPAAGAVAAIPIRKRAQPDVRYAIAVVRSSDERAAARRFVSIALSEDGRRALRAAGFGVP